jgi:hypothetical protein
MRLCFDVLEAMLQGLTARLLVGKLSIDRYVEEYDEIVAFSGWTLDDFGREVDSRWAHSGRQSPRPVFLC